jgi:glycine/D-amino acid oxidase-like deaminating enzyme
MAYTAKRLPKLTGVAGWNAILPPQAALPVLDADTTADIVIVGGGFAGLSAARRFHSLDPKLKIILLEAGQFGEGSSGRNSGFMIDLPHDLASENYAGDGLEADKATIALNRQAIAFGHDAVDEFDIPQEFFDPCGKINAAATSAGDQHNLDYAAHLENLGEISTHLSHEEMVRRTGSSHYTSGLFTPGTVMVQPAGYVRMLSAGLSWQVGIYENSPVLGFERQGQNWMVKTDKARVSTPRVVLANNSHVESFGFFQRQLMHIFLYASISKPMSADQIARLGGDARWSVTPSDPVGTSVRRVSGSSGNRILIRNGSTYRAGMESSKALLNRAGKIHTRKFKERFSMLNDLEMEHRWAGLLCLSKNGAPAFGELDDGVFAACCQNGLGIARGTLQGMGVADLVVNGGSDISAHFLKQPAPQKLPPEPLASIGANAYLKWKEWRSGAE